ncbi:MAG: ATP-dependent nuclease [Promethearchaeota archaeon]
MNLERLIIINYKSCRNIILNILKNSPNTFIGINDAGKTVILNSIGNLLENKSLILSTEPKLASDLSNTPITTEEYENIFNELKLPIFTYNANNIIFIGIFQIEHDDLNDNFDQNASDQLKWSIDSYSNDRIILMKVYSNDNPQGKYYLCCTEDKSQKRTLWSQSQKVLDALIKEMNITADDIDNDNKKGRFKKLEKFRAIYFRLDTEILWCEYNDFLKKDRKFFPKYRYLDWKISMKDIENLATDTMSLKIESYKNELKSKAEELSEKANQDINVELNGRTKELFKELENIKCLKVGVSFSVSEKISDIVIEKKTSDGDIKLESQGEGVKKQIWFAFLKWTSLQNIPDNIKTTKYIWCFDEPEVHLYPSAQRELYEIIKKITKGVFQIFLSTHSTIFIDRVDIKDINQVSLKEGYSVVSKCKDIQDIHDSLEVKNSDILFYDKFFAVEGFTDNYLIPYFYRLYFNRTVSDDSIRVINLRGKDNWANNKRLFESIMKDFKKDNDLVFYFLDADSGVRGDNVCLIGRYDIEDSISNEIWIKLVKDCCRLDISDADLEAIRKNLSDGKNNKFYKQLQRIVLDHKDNQKEKKVYLPEKGPDLAKELMKHIKDIKDIPPEIIEAFRKLE